MPRAARAFFNFCVDEELLTVSPMRKVKMPRSSKEIQPAFTPDDVRAILGACATPREHMHGAFACSTPAAGRQNSWR